MRFEILISIVLAGSLAFAKTQPKAPPPVATPVPVEVPAVAPPPAWATDDFFSGVRDDQLRDSTRRFLTMRRDDSIADVAQRRRIAEQRHLDSVAREERLAQEREERAERRRIAKENEAYVQSLIDEANESSARTQRDREDQAKRERAIERARANGWGSAASSGTGASGGTYGASTGSVSTGSTSSSVSGTPRPAKGSGFQLSLMKLASKYAECSNRFTSWKELESCEKQFEKPDPPAAPAKPPEPLKPLSQPKPRSTSGSSGSEKTRVIPFTH